MAMSYRRVSVLLPVPPYSPEFSVYSGKKTCKKSM